MREKTTKNKIKKIVLIEMVFLTLGIIISLMGVMKVLKYSSSDWGFIFFPIIGIVFFIILFVVKRKRFAWIPGLIFLQIFLIVGGYGLICCEVNASVNRKLIYYEDKTIEAQVDDSVYEWNGNTWHNKDEGFQRFDEIYHDKSASVYIDGEEKGINSLYCDGLHDVLFYLVIDGPPNVYLVLEKQR